MKEIWKLLELLNEYLSPFSWYIHYHNKNEFKRTPTKSAVEWDRMLQDEYICSKKFWFIKWLIENDKIDIDKLEKKVLKENLIRKFDEWLLMLLSISDTPIEDLISYLK